MSMLTLVTVLFGVLLGYGLGNVNQMVEHNEKVIVSIKIIIVILILITSLLTFFVVRG